MSEIWDSETCVISFVPCRIIHHEELPRLRKVYDVVKQTRESIVGKILLQLQHSAEYLHCICVM